MKALTRIGMAIALAGALVLTGCNLNGGGSDSGLLSLSLTDAPINDADVTGVYINITGIEYNRNGTWSEMIGFDGPQEYDLLELTGDSSALLGDLSLPSGEYTQIRFQLDAVDEGSAAPSNPGSYIEFNDGIDNGGSESALFVPSGAQTGYKAEAEQPFLVPSNGSVSITADFDVRQAVVDLAQGGDYILKPVLRLVVDDQAGHISGDVTYSGGNSVMVFAYEDGSYDSSEPTEGDNGFPDAVTGAVVEDSDNDGTLDYTLGFLAEGTYDIVTAEYNSDGTLDETSVTPETGADVVVSSGVTTTHNITLP